MCDRGGGGRGRKRRHAPDGFEKWGGYMGAKIAKLQGQYSNELASHERATHNATSQDGAGCKGIFDGIAIFVNGYTEPTGEELKRIMMNNGGIYHHYNSRSQTTHIIASNLPDSKIRNLNTDRIVSPKWIVDSLEAGRLLDYTKYLLYTRQSRSQPKITFKKSYSTEIFTEKEEFVSNDLQIMKSTGFASEDSKDNMNEKISTNSKIDFKNVKVENITIEMDNDFINDGIEEETLEKEENSINNISTENQLLDIKPEVKSSQSLEEFEDTIAHSKQLNNPNNPSPSKEHTMSTANPNFLSEFYNNSRLHHISTMAAAFKQYVNEMQTKNDGFPGREHLNQWLRTNKEEIFDAKENHQITDKNNKKTIMHIDMDCFFVSVGLRNHSELRGKPVAVTHAKGNSTARPHPNRDRSSELKYYQERALKKIKAKLPSVNQTKLVVPSGDIDLFEDDDEIQLKVTTKNNVKDETLDKELLEKHQHYSSFSMIDEESSMSEISSCSYEARKAGVKNGMFLGPALKLCPDLKTIPYDFDGYKEVSYKLYDIVGSYTHDIEAVSCDEMFVDLSSVLHHCDATPLEFASCIREQIQAATGCPCSVGLSNSILGARMATRKAKPNGQFFLAHEDLPNYMKDQPVKDLPGVGSSLSRRLEASGVTNCGQLQNWTLGRLQSEFGTRTGLSLFNYCRGVDDRSVKTEHQRKSVSAEVNYGIRFTCQADAVCFVEKLSAEVSHRMTSINMMGKCITLKLKVRAKDAPIEPSKFMGHGVCDNIAKSISLHAPTDSASLIQKHVLALMQQVKSPIHDYRGVGIQVSKLEDLKESNIKKGASSIKSFLSSKLSLQKKNVERVDKSKVRLEFSNEDQDMLSETIQGRVSSKLDITVNKKHEKSSIFKYQSNMSTSSGGSNESEKQPVRKESKPTIDLDVLMALPPDIQQQVIAEYNQQGYDIDIPSKAAKTLQTRSTKPDTQSTSSGENKQLNISKLTAHPIKSLREEESMKTSIKRDNNNTEENNLPGPSGYNPRNTSVYKEEDINDDMNTSISQVNSSFLAALPEDIREEIRANSHQHKNTKSLILDQEESKSSDFTSFSQVDASFLDALPDDMKEELEQELKRQKRMNNTGSQQPLVLKSPTKKQAITKGILKSPKKQATTKGKRGRPRKTDSKNSKNNRIISDRNPINRNEGKQFNDQSLKNLKNAQNTKIKTNITRDQETENFSSQIIETSEAIINTDIFTKSDKNEEPAEEVKDFNKGPNLCGVEKVKNIKSLITEWVSSCEGPEKEDIDILVTFYTSLIEHRDLETLDLLVKFLYKNVDKTCNKHWEAAYTIIMENIQVSMLDKYSIKLKVRDSFR